MESNEALNTVRSFVLQANTLGKQGPSTISLEHVQTLDASIRPTNKDPKPMKKAEVVNLEPDQKYIRVDGPVGPITYKRITDSDKLKACINTLQQLQDAVFMENRPYFKDVNPDTVVFVELVSPRDLESIKIDPREIVNAS